MASGLVSTLANIPLAGPSGWCRQVPIVSISSRVVSLVTPASGTLQYSQFAICCLCEVVKLKPYFENYLDFLSEFCWIDRYLQRVFKVNK